MTERAHRIGLNEAVFRQVNERIGELADSFELSSEPLDLVCECGDATCMDRITMTRAEYERLRSDPLEFAVHSGHETPEVETVVARHEGYDVVRKREGVPEQVAEQTDPRT